MLCILQHLVQESDRLRAVIRWLIVLILTLGLVPAWGQERIPGEFLVKLKAQGGFGAANKLYAKAAGRASMKSAMKALHVYHLKAASDSEAGSLMAELMVDPDVEFVEPNYRIRIAQATAASAWIAASDVGQFTAGGTYSQSSAPTRVSQAWNDVTSSLPTVPVVAVIDSGIEYTHGVFTGSGAVWNNPGETGTDSLMRDKRTNGVDDDANGYVDDYRGWNFINGTNNAADDNNHGTHCAGIVLGVTQDIFATPIGTARIRIMPLKFLDSSGSGSTAGAVSAIYYAVANGAHVINNSWGGSSYSQSLHDALKWAYDQGVVLTAAAGNNSANIDSSPMYPAAYPVPGQVTVAATTNVDGLAGFSNFGAVAVALGAPGSSVLSTVRGGGFMSMNGTSMAAPFVAGLAALAKRENPDLNAFQLRNLLRNSVDTISALNGRTTTGGRSNAQTVVTLAKSSVGSFSAFGGPQPSYSASAPAGASREPASEGGGKKGGCGTIAWTTGVGGPGSGFPTFAAVFAVVWTLLPMLVWMTLRRRRKKGAALRKHPRFVMHSDVKIKMGDRELSGHMNTISVGGIGFDVDAMLDRGGSVTVLIQSPDGDEQVSVEGRVVWQESGGRYGLQFDQAKESIQNRILAWTSSLKKAS